MSQIEERDAPADDVRSAIASLQKGASNDAPPPPDESALGEPPRSDDDPEAALDRVADDRARDDKGRFVAKEEELESKAPKDTLKAPVAEAQSPAAKPPVSWAPDALAQWEKLSPAIQAAVLKREKEFSDGIVSKSNELKAWKDIESILGPRRQTYQQLGFKSDLEAINHLFAFSDNYQRDPAGLIRHLITASGLKPEQLFPQTGGQQPQAQQTPQQQPQPQQIDALVQEQIGMQFARLETEQFASNPAHEHFNELRPLMATFLTSGTAANLQDAYDRAMWATPNLREKMMVAQTSQATARLQEDARAKADKAKRASNASLNGAPHGATVRPKRSDNPHEEMADDVRFAIEQLR